MSLKICLHLKLNFLIVYGYLHVYFQTPGPGGVVSALCCGAGCQLGVEVALTHTPPKKEDPLIPYPSIGVRIPRVLRVSFSAA